MQRCFPLSLSLPLSPAWAVCSVFFLFCGGYRVFSRRPEKDYFQWVPLEISPDKRFTLKADLSNASSSTRGLWYPPDSLRRGEQKHLLQLLLINSEVENWWKSKKTSGITRTTTDVNIRNSTGKQLTWDWSVSSDRYNFLVYNPWENRQYIANTIDHRSRVSARHRTGNYLHLDFSQCLRDRNGRWTTGAFLWRLCSSACDGRDSILSVVWQVCDAKDSYWRIKYI